MKIWFRVDASEGMGLGHLKRCQVLAKEFIKKDCEVRFFSTSETQKFLQADSFGISYQFIDALDSLSFLQNASSPDLFIIDHYELGIEFEQAVSKMLNTHILVIDDFHHRPHACDYFLNQNYGFSAEQYQGLVPASCKLLLGTSYALLDEIYAHARKDACLPGTKVENILINFGGTDPFHVCTFVLKAIQQLDYKGSIDIVLGYSTEQKEKLASLIQNAMFQVKIHDYVPLLPLMNKADLMIGAGGSSTWERCCLGKPSMIMSTSSDQIQIAEDLDKAKVIMYLGHYDTISQQKLRHAIFEICDNHEMRNLIAANAYKLCDGLGTSRLVEEIYADYKNRQS